MKTKITILLVALFASFNIGFAQQNEECMNNLSIFNDYAKNNKYDEAYEPWMKVRTKCPKFNRAIYVSGEKILEHKIENAVGADKVAFENDLLLLNTEYNEHFSSKYANYKMLEDNANLKYKFREDLGLSDADLYPIFDEIYKTEKENFKDPKALYTYYSLMVSLYDAGAKTPQQLFDKFDDVSEKIETEVEKATAKLNVLLAKEEAATTLTKKEEKYKRFYQQTLEAYETISDSMDKITGQRANCEVLIPLYQKDFEAFKNDATWLQRAMNRMYNKGCKDDPLFLKLVEQKNRIQPNADTAFYLYLLTNEQKYFDQTIQLESDPLKKAKLYKKLAGEFKDKGSYGKARQYYMEALKLNPSDGRPYLSIAAMYAKSANSCGDSNFNKRAVFWLAANEAAKAGNVDSRLKSAASQTVANYNSKAPSKADIFSAANSGQTITIGCWIGRSVTVPK